MANSIRTNKGISDLFQAAKITFVEVRASAVMAVCPIWLKKNIFCQATQHTIATLKIEENETSFLLYTVGHHSCQQPHTFMYVSVATPIFGFSSNYAM